MLSDLAFIACGSPLNGSDAGSFFLILISLLSGAIMAIINLILLGIIELRGRTVWWHLLTWFTYVTSGVLILLGVFSNNTFSLVAIALILMAIAIIITFHLIYLFDLLRQSRKPPP